MLNEWGSLVHQKYDQLGFKLHKPGEWTVIAGILDMTTSTPKVIAVGAGLKCLPSSAITPELRHQLIRDSHAEVLARRALLRYLLANHPPSRLAMYISHAPCGDASMHVLEQPEGKRRKLLRGRDDAKMRGLRTKPGRRDSPPTECVSCSDKLALWGTIGWQGALAGTVLGVIRVEEMQIGELYDEVGLEQGINDKIPEEWRYQFTEYKGKPFKYSRGAVLATGIEESALVPSSISQVWYEGGTPETLADGRKLGSKKPKSNLPIKMQSCVSTENISRSINTSVRQGKLGNLQYQKTKAKVLSTDPFEDWPVSDPEMKTFREKALEVEAELIT